MSRVGSHLLVMQLLKRISQLCHPEPKYSYTWKVSEILKYIKSLGKNEELGLKLVSYKLVMHLVIDELYCCRASE